MKDNYNGWTNYETWLVNLWIDNDQSEQRFWAGMAEKFAEESAPRHSLTAEQAAQYEMSDYLKDTFEDRAEAKSGVTGFWADLVGAALASVAWDEIAKALLSNVEVSDDA